MDRGSAYHCRPPLGSNQSAVHRLSPQTLPWTPCGHPPFPFPLKIELQYFFFCMYSVLLRKRLLGKWGRACGLCRGFLGRLLATGTLSSFFPRGLSAP